MLSANPLQIVLNGDGVGIVRKGRCTIGIRPWSWRVRPKESDRRKSVRSNTRRQPSYSCFRSPMTVQRNQPSITGVKRAMGTKDVQEVWGNGIGIVELVECRSSIKIATTCV